MGAGRWAVVSAFLLGAAGTAWWFLPGIVKRINTGTPAEIAIHAAFPILLAFFCLYMAFRTAISKEDGAYRPDKDKTWEP